MSTFFLRLIERLHGHLGWLGVVALVHPALLLRRPRRSASLSAILSTGLVTGTFASGLWLYPSYRREVKPFLFQESAPVGWMFERKEHLAVGVLVLAWSGLLAHLAHPRGRDRERQILLGRLAHWSFAGAAVLAAVVAVLGTLVASWRSF